MAIPNISEKSVALDRAENLTRGNLSAKRVALYQYDAGSDTLIPASTQPSYGCNDIVPPYYGFTTADGAWQIKQVQSSGVSYATALNNSSYTAYNAAWANKATLIYGRFDEAF